MSVDALLARLAVPSAVPPVPSRFPGEGTGEPFVNQGGSPSSLGSPEKVDSQGDISGTAPDWHGFSLSYLEAAAGPDWPDIRDRLAALAALAGLLRTQAQRNRGEVPSHYTQACECATCGPVWLWEGAPARLIACPWCLTGNTGAPTPRPDPPVFCRLETEENPHGTIPAG